MIDDKKSIRFANTSIEPADAVIITYKTRMRGSKTRTKRRTERKQTEVISRMKEGCRSSLVADLRVVFIDISGDVAEYAYIHTGPRVCMCWLNSSGQKGVQYEWIGWCMAQRAIVTSCSHLLELRRSFQLPPRILISVVISSLAPLLITFLLLFRPQFYFAFSLRRTLSRFLGDFRDDFISRRIFY